MKMQNVNTANEPTTIVQQAKRHYEDCLAGTSEVRRDMLDDLRFLSGDQWPEHVRKDRNDDRRPCLTVNVLPTYVAQIVNDFRENKTSVSVIPVEDSDEDTSDVIDGLVRAIQTQSDSEIAYVNAFESAVACGIGYWRIATEYVDNDSDLQTIRISRIENPFSVHIPFHLSRQPDFRDAPYTIITEWVTKSEFSDRYGDKVDLQNFASPTQGDDSWMTEDRCLIAEYWVRDVKTTRTKTKTGRTRIVETVTVRCYIIGADEILDEYDWPVPYIPIVAVTGREQNIEGRKNFISLTRHAKDPCRMRNYWASSKTELLALAPKSPYVGVAGQFSGHERQWENANVKNLAYLEYEPVTIQGQVVGAPQRQQPAQISTGFVDAERQSIDDVKAVTGIYDASLGNRSNETSGRAILARQHQGDTSSFHFFDSMARAMRYTGRILVALIPHIYDTARSVRILGPDSVAKIVRVNQEHRDENGRTRLYDVTVGTYDVVSESGPSYQTKKTEVSDLLLRLVQANPAIGAAMPDLIARYVDLPNEIVERLRKTLPAELTADDEDGQPPPPDPRMMQEMQQMQGMVQQLDQVVQKLMAENEQLKAAQDDKEADRQAKLAIAQMGNETRLQQTAMTHAHDVGMAEMSAVDQEQSAALAQVMAALESFASRLDTLESAQSTSPVAVRPTASYEDLMTDASVPQSSVGA
jgi:hypothetical protein